MAVKHTPVLVRELLTLLCPKAGGIYFDATVGAGGHAKALFAEAGGPIKLIACDRDSKALVLAKEVLSPFASQVEWAEDNFGEISGILKSLGLEAVDGIYADLGVSSMQLFEADRGFSFQQKGPLDMRMSLKEGNTALGLMESLEEKELARILYRYGEERSSFRIAREIKKALSRGELETTTDLGNLVVRCYPFKGRRQSRIHPATRTFQALRIAVNRELESLETFLEKAPYYLRPGGVLAVISYHSLEDRIVKHRFKNLEKEGFALCEKKPLTPAEKEVEENPRSRSAKLRGLKRGSNS